jgi:hypothetical protein
VWILLGITLLTAFIIVMIIGGGGQSKEPRPSDAEPVATQPASGPETAQSG